MAKQENEAIETAISSNDENELKSLKKHSSLLVLHALARNENTPFEVLNELKDHPDMLVRDYSIRNLCKKEK